MTEIRACCDMLHTAGELGGWRGSPMEQRQSPFQHLGSNERRHGRIRILVLQLTTKAVQFKLIDTGQRLGILPIVLNKVDVVERGQETGER